MHSNASHKSYRPVASFLFRVEKHLWGFSNPRPWHLTNVLLHSLCTHLVERLANHVLPGEEAVVYNVIGILFAVHPIHTESVSNITGCCEILCAIFMLLSYLSFVNLNSWLSFPAGLSLAVLATLSKEIGFTVLGLMFAFLVAQELQRIKTKMKNSSHLSFNSFSQMRMSTLMKIVTLFACGTFLLWCRLKIQHNLPNFSPFQNAAVFHPNRLTRLLSLAHVAVFHAYLMVFPNILCPDYSNVSIPVLESMLDQRVLLVCIGLTCFTGIALWTIRFALRVDTEASPVILSLAWLFLPFIPSSNLFFPVGFTIAERVLYSPSIGYCLVIGKLLSGFLQWSGSLSKDCGQKIRAIGVKLLYTVLAIMFCRTLLRDFDWNNNERLWSNSVKACPANAVHFGNLGHVRLTQGRLDEAENLLKKSAELPRPMDNTRALVTLAHIHRLQGRDDDAFKICETIA